jgi:hypothetical protein
MELTFGSLSFYIGPLGSTRLSDLTKLGPSASKIERITASESSVGSSSEVNSLVSLTATEDMKEKLEEFDETRGKPGMEEAVAKTHDCRWISCCKNTGYHATDPKIRTQGAEHGRSWIATKNSDGSLETSNAQRTAERDTELYPGSGPSW